MTKDSSSFLIRRGLRTASRELTQMLVLGFGIGFIALGLGSYKYFIVADAWDNLWKAVAWFGGAAVLVTLIAPFVWYWPEQMIRRFGNWAGHRLMNVILVIIYYAFFWPVGSLMRATKGTHPIYEWERAASEQMEGWRTKELPPDVAGAHANSHQGKLNRVGFFSVLVFFGRRGHFILIPVLLALVSIGIALFFLQTSALAPFIYTLF